MYRTHFLKNNTTTIKKDVQSIITQVIDQIYRRTHNDLGLPECEIIISTNPKKIRNGEMFSGSSYDETAIHLFADTDAIHKTVSNDKNRIIENITEHCYRSLYTTARTKHIGLDADCGLLEEVINEGLAEIFVTEKMDTEPKKRFTQLPKKEIERLWGKIKSEHNAMPYPDIEKWFWGNEKEKIPPFTACSVGYAIATAYLSPFKKKSYEALTTPAKQIAKKQSHY